MRENYSKLARLSSNHFHSANNKLWGKIYDWELKMKAVWNTCDKELGSEMRSIYENYSKTWL